MKVILFVMDDQRVNLDHLYEVVRDSCASCEVVRLCKHEQQHLAQVFRRVDIGSYQRVVIFSRLKRLRGQLALLRAIPGLVFLEHDACQNYMPSSKYYRQYSRFYRQLPWARVLASSLGVQRRLAAEGVDSRFVSKGYDEQFFVNQQQPRDIECAFLGSLKGHTYAERRSMLSAIAAVVPLRIGRTETREEYLQLLNRTRIFVSADVGMGEYMIKNFEAMACGCALVACSQGDEEDAALGFVDGENVLLYRSADEALEKIAQLRSDTQLAERIARAGQRFAEQRFGFARIGADLAAAIQAPMREWPGLTRWQRVHLRLRYGGGW